MVEAGIFSYGEGLKPTIEAVSVKLNPTPFTPLSDATSRKNPLKIIQGLCLERPGFAGWRRYFPVHAGELARGWPLQCPLPAPSAQYRRHHFDATDEEVVKASEAAGAHKFVIEMDGYATEIGGADAGCRAATPKDRHTRALVGDPPALLLDEPSSSLDRQAEIEPATS